MVEEAIHMNEFPEMRKVERHVDRDEWEEIPLAYIKQWDVFRLFEPDGTPVVGRDGGNWFVAFGDGFIHMSGIALVHSKEYQGMELEDMAVYLEGWRNRNTES